MNTIAPPSHLSVIIGVNCPVWTCRAKPGLPCINQQGSRLKQCHRLRADKATGRSRLR
jgi:hypothetical protein